MFLLGKYIILHQVFHFLFFFFYTLFPHILKQVVHGNIWRQKRKEKYHEGEIDDKTYMCT